MASLIFQRASGESGVVTFDATITEHHLTSAEASEHPVEDGANVSDHVHPNNDRITLEVAISNTPLGSTASHMDGATAQIQGASISIATPRRRTGQDPQMVDPGQSPRSVRDVTKGVQVASLFAPSQVRGPLGVGLTLAGSITLPSRPPVFQAAPQVEAGNESAQVMVLQFSNDFDRVRAVHNELDSMVKNGTVCEIVTTLRSYPNMILESIETPRDVESGSGIKMLIQARAIRIVTSLDVEVVTITPAKKTKDLGAQKTTPATPGQKKSILQNLNAPGSALASGVDAGIKWVMGMAGQVTP